jgi:hypothetical protein
MKRIDIKHGVSAPTPEIEDKQTLRMGSMSPAFPRVQPGSKRIADDSKVQMGSMSPTFPVRAG